MRWDVMVTCSLSPIVFSKHGAKIFQELVLQVGQSPEILETFQSHAIIAFVVLFPGDSWRFVGILFLEYSKSGSAGGIDIYHFMDISRHVCFQKQMHGFCTYKWQAMNFIKIAWEMFLAPRLATSSAGCFLHSWSTQRMRSWDSCATFWCQI